MTAQVTSERRAVVMGVTGDHAFAAGALLAGLLRHAPGFDADVVLFHDGLDAGAQAAFRRLHPRVVFRPFDASTVAARLGLPPDHKGLMHVLARVSAMTLAKLDLPALLDDHDRCVWLDADILVRGPWAEVWDFGVLAWRGLPPGALARRRQTLQALPFRRPDPAVPLPNGGVVGVARGLPAVDPWAQARLLVERTDAGSVDELALYMMAATGGVPVTPLPLALNHPVTQAGGQGAVLLHAIGPHKFWNATPLVQMWPEWAAAQAQWVAAGGQPYAGPVHLAEVHPADPADVLRAARLRSAWLAYHDRLLPDLPEGLRVDPRLDRRHLRLTIAGRPQDWHLRLAFHANPRRMALDLRLPEPLRGRALATLRAALADLREGDEMSVPAEAVPLALRLVLGVVADDGA